MVEPHEWDEMVSVGRIARPHGNRGRVIVDPDSDFVEERFAPGRTVFLRQGTDILAYTIDDVRFHRERPIIGLDGVTSISMAEALASAELRVPATELAALPPGRYYHHELVGCLVETVDGARVGLVRDIEGSEGADRLIVGHDEDEVQVPLVDAICIRIDLEARRIEIDPPEGLLDLNQTGAQGAE